MVSASVYYSWPDHSCTFAVVDVVTSLGAAKYVKASRKRSSELHTYLIMGTENSRVVKVEMRDNKFHKINYYSQRDSELGPFLPNPAFDPKSGNFYALTTRSLTQIPTKSCSVFSSCAACFRSGDTCYWVKGKCKHYDDVPNPTDRELECPPEVYNFEPKVGPIQGGTVITFYGYNFGNHTLDDGNSDFIRVKVGDRKCTPLQRLPTKFKCKIDKDSTSSDVEQGAFCR